MPNHSFRVDSARNDKGDFGSDSKQSISLPKVKSNLNWIAAESDVILFAFCYISMADFKGDYGNDVSDIQRSLQSLYEYNMVLRDDLVAAQSKIDALTSKQANSGYNHKII